MRLSGPLRVETWEYLAFVKKVSKEVGNCASAEGWAVLLEEPQHRPRPGHEDQGRADKETSFLEVGLAKAVLNKGTKGIRKVVIATFRGFLSLPDWIFLHAGHHHTEIGQTNGT